MTDRHWLASSVRERDLQGILQNAYQAFTLIFGPLRTLLVCGTALRWLIWALLRLEHALANFTVHHRNLILVQPSLAYRAHSMRQQAGFSGQGAVI